MSLQIAVGNFEKRSGTGNQTVTFVDQDGAAFVPGGFLFFTTGVTGSNGFNDNARVRWSCGFDDLTHRRSQSDRAKDNTLADDPGVEYLVDSFFSKTYSVCVPSAYWAFNPQNTITTAGYVDSAASGSFVFKWVISESATTNMKISYIAIGGSGISCVAGSFDASAGGTMSVTGLGITPTCVFFTTQGAVSGNEEGLVAFTPNIGWANAAGCQGALSSSYVDLNPGTHRAGRLQRVDKCVAESSYSTMTKHATITSMQSGGFTINQTGDTTSAIAYLAISGCTVAVGSFPRPGTFGNRSTLTGLGIDPVAVMLATTGLAASSSVQSGASMSISLHDNNSSRAQWFGMLDNQTTSVFAEYANTGGPIAATPLADGTASTLLSKVTEIELLTDGFAVNWSVSPAETVQRQYLFVAFAPSGTAQSTCTFTAVDEVTSEVILEDKEVWELNRFDVKVRTEEKS